MISPRVAGSVKADVSRPAAKQNSPGIAPGLFCSTDRAQEQVFLVQLIGFEAVLVPPFPVAVSVTV